MLTGSHPSKVRESEEHKSEFTALVTDAGLEELVGEGAAFSEAVCLQISHMTDLHQGDCLLRGSMLADLASGTGALGLSFVFPTLGIHM